MDLQTISSQMKVVIQKHQIVVTEMRNDPQNPVLQKRLRDLQSEIHSLNERQKQIVEDLRKNLEKKQSSPNSCSSNSSGFPTASHSPSPQIPSQELRMLCCAQKCPIQNHKLQTTTIVTKPIANCVNAVRQTVPPTINNIATPTATFTFKAPVGTVVLPNCSTASALLSSKVAEHQKMHPVLVVPSPSNRTVDGPQTGVLFNLVPPIRVPQYPPPSPIPRTSTPISCQKNQVLNNCIPVAFTSTPTAVTSHLNNNIESNVATLVVNSRVNSNEKYQPLLITEKINHKIDQKKKEFLKALGLVSRESLSDIKNKRLERKRRSTANPQFSNAALEEKWRNAAVAQATAVPPKRPRGRPRLESKPVLCPTNGICSPTIAKPIEPRSPPVNISSANCTVSSSSSPLSDSSGVMNGVHKLVPNTEDGKSVEQMLSGLCIVCTQPGDLVKCDSCAKQQHLGCMQPPVIARPQVPWQCSECQSRNVSLIVVQNYEMVKAAKEDEKRKLLKKSLELRLKRSQLESRLNQLRELSGTQKSRQSEMQTSLKELQTFLDHIHCVVNGVRMCS